jgi:hypothetical protein
MSLQTENVPQSRGKRPALQGFACVAILWIIYVGIAPTDVRPAASTLTFNPAQTETNPTANGSADTQSKDSRKWDLTWQPQRCLAHSLIPSSSPLLRRCEITMEKSAFGVRYCKLHRSEVSVIVDGGLCAMWASGRWYDASSGQPRSITIPELNVAWESLLSRRNVSASRAQIFDDTVAELRRGFEGDETWNASAELVFTPLEIIATLVRFMNVSKPVANPGAADVVDSDARYILFTGDSMLRQFQARLVQLIRRQHGPHFEHTSLGEVTYLIGTKGDLLIIRPRPQVPRRPKAARGKQTGATSAAPPAPYTVRLTGPDGQLEHRESLGERLLRIDFMWVAAVDDFPFHSFDSDSLSSMSELPTLYPRPRMHLHAFMYWTGNNPNTAATAVKAMKQFFYHTQVRLKHHIWHITTPPREPALADVNTAWNEYLRQRNAVLHAKAPERLYDWWTALEQAAPLVLPGGNNGSYLPAISRQENCTGWMRPFRKDDKHFMCTFDPKIPSTPTQAREDMSGCHDLVNSIFVRWWLRDLLSLVVQK